VINSPEKRTGIAYVLEFVSSIVANVFCQTPCFFLSVQLVVVPHSEDTHYDSVRRSYYYVAVWKTDETYESEINPMLVPCSMWKRGGST
jgi:hypothetical protein